MNPVSHLFEFTLVILDFPERFDILLMDSVDNEEDEKSDNDLNHLVLMVRYFINRMIGWDLIC